MIFVLVILTIYVGPVELRLTCQDVKHAVSQYGIFGARNYFQKLAREKGVSLTWENYIEARKCL